MNQKRNPLIIVLAVVGVCGIVYGLWHLYAQRGAQDQARALFSAPASSGVPDFLHATPGAPPIQPH